jgi:CBS domain containing-hemolysin-like protein
METHSIFILMGLLAASAFFSAAETALFTISMAKAVQLEKEAGRVYRLIKRLKDDPLRLLTTVRIGNHLANIAAASMATAIVFRLAASHAVAIATGIMTLAVLVFGEMFPKAIATRNHLRVAWLVAVPLYGFSRLIYPLVLFLNLIPRVAERIHGAPQVTEEELLTMVEAVEEDGQIKEQEMELIHNIFEFDDTSASEIMTPRADMFVIDANRALDLPEIFKSGFTRIPVIDGDIDDIIGILNIKDLLLHQSTAHDIDLRKIMREPYFVPEHKKLDKLLQGFKRRKQHMAIVVDEHGGISGLITLEDALEEIVGEIIDETDVFEPPIVTVTPTEWRVMGKAEIEEVNEKLQMKIPDTGEYETFSGYILNHIGRIPKEKEEIAIGDFTVVVKVKKGNRIIEYHVRRSLDAPLPAEATAPV